MASSMQAMARKSTSIEMPSPMRASGDWLSEMRFDFATHPGEGEKGPQASTVVPIGKHHLPPDRT